METSVIFNQCGRASWVGRAVGCAAVAFFLVLSGAAAAAEWSLKEAAKPYAGQKIHCAGDGYAPYVAYQKLSEEFTEITGIEVEWEVASLEILQPKLLADVLNNTGVFDCAEVESANMGLWIAQKFTTPMERFLDDPQLRDPSFDPMTGLIPENLEMTSMEDGVIHGLPYHFIPRFFVTRTDLSKDSGERAAFNAKYGYDMPVIPNTWQEYTDVAEFFTRDAGETLAGEVLTEDFYGTALQFKRDLGIQYEWEFFLNAFGGVMFDESGDVAFDSDIGVKALDYWLSMRKYVSPAYLEYNWDNTFSDMCEGRVYTYPTWGDTTPFLEDREGCPKVAGNLTYGPVPGTHQTGADGQSWIIPPSSKVPEATFLFLQWISTFDIQKRCQFIGCTSTRTDVWFDPAFDDEPRTQVTREIMKNGYLVVRAKPPALAKISTILIDELHEAALGSQTAAEALKRAGEQSRALLEQ